MDSMGCKCWEMQGGEKKNPIILELPPKLKAMLHGGVRVKTMPALTEKDIAQIEVEEQQFLESGDTGEQLYVVDADGVKHYE